MRVNLKQLTKIGILSLIVSFWLVSCQKEDTVSTDEDFAETEAIDFSKLNLTETNFEDLFNTITINLDNETLSRVNFGLSSNLNSRTTESIITVDNDNVFFAQYENSNFTTFRIIETSEDESFRNLVIENIDSNEPIAKILTYFPNENWIYSNPDFTVYEGDVAIEDFAGTWQVASREQYCFIATTPTWGCAWDSASGHEPGYPGCNGGNFITGYTSESDCYDFSGGEGSGGGNGDGEGTGGGSGTGNDGENDLPLITKPDKPCAPGYIKDDNNICIIDDDYQIINELTGKALCVYNKLKSSSTGFKNAVKKFEPQFPVAHLKFDMGDTGTARGITIPPDNGTLEDGSPDYVITIRINNNNTNSGVTKRPNLLVAKTIAHEVLHAEMFRKMLSLAKQGHLDFTGWTAEEQTSYIISIKENFPGIYDYYRRHKNWQHAQMATHYREREFGKDVV